MQRRQWQPTPVLVPGKSIALTKQTFVGKVVFLLFNMLSRLVITFPPRSKRLLILWLQSSSAVILEPPKIKSVQLFATPWTVAFQAPLSMRFPRQEYWSRLPFPLSGDLPNLGIKPASPALAGGFFITEPPGKPVHSNSRL